MDKVKTLASQIAARGVGQAPAVAFGVQLSQIAGVTKPELWRQGLGRASTRAERTKVARVVAEWADGDSVAAHYGFGMDLFCSEDFARSGNGQSILDSDNRRWLTAQFGIQFVTLAELAQRVMSSSPSTA